MRPSTADSSSSSLVRRFQKTKATANGLSFDGEQQPPLNSRRQSSRPTSAFGKSTSSVTPQGILAAAIVRPMSALSSISTSSDAVVAAARHSPNRSTDIDSECLMRPLSAGLLRALTIIDFSELSQRGILDASDDALVHFNHEDVDALYVAKCQDQRCASSNIERRTRFHVLISHSCRGRYVDLRGCGFGAEGTKALARMLAHNRFVTCVDLSTNSIGAEGARALAELLKQNDTICVLRLQSANVGDGVESLAEALMTNNTLTALDLGGVTGATRNCIWGASVVALAKALRHNRVMAQLDLLNCGLRQSTAVICDALADGPSQSITSLNLGENHCGDAACRSIGRLLQSTHTPLQQLNVSSNGISNRGLRVLCSCIRDRCHALAADAAPSATTHRQEPSVGGGAGRSGGAVSPLAVHLASSHVDVNAFTHLNLANNMIDGVELHALAAVVQTSQLQVLVLDDNDLCNMGIDPADGGRRPPSTAGVGKLFDACIISATMKRLSMARCHIRSLPATFAEAIGNARSLTDLDMTGNQLRGCGQEICRALTVNHTLSRFAAAECGMDLDDIKAIAPVLATHPTLQSVALFQSSRVPLEDSGVVEAVRRSQTLTSVDFGKIVAEQIASALERNAALRRARAQPLLDEARHQHYLQERALTLTQNAILEEVKRKEKLLETGRATRDRKKAALAVLASEWEELCEDYAKDSQAVQATDAKVTSSEDALNEKRRQMDVKDMSLRRNIDLIVSETLDMYSRAYHLWAAHLARCPESTVAPPAAPSCYSIANGRNPPAPSSATSGSQKTHKGGAKGALAGGPTNAHFGGPHPLGAPDAFHVAQQELAALQQEVKDAQSLCKLFSSKMEQSVMSLSNATAAPAASGSAARKRRVSATKKSS